MLDAVLIIAATVAATELAATLIHRYVMHGFGWAWHRSHHEPHDGWFETNDLYALIFAALSMALILATPLWPPGLWIGIGLIVYGILYSLVHDGLVHQRWPFRHLPRRGYLRRLYQAHKLHHAVEGQHGCVSFGFLYAAPVADLKRRLRAAGPVGAADEPAKPPSASVRSGHG